MAAKGRNIEHGSAGQGGATPRDCGPSDGHDPARRRRILDGARAMFLEGGFEGTSMGEIARAAGVSKGTLYVYFANKEQLFVAIMEGERERHLKPEFSPEPGADARAALTAFGTKLVRFLSQPQILAAMRTAMSIAERMPEVGRGFYERGPQNTLRNIAAWLDERIDAGELAIADTILAAAQFVDLCQASIIRPALFGVELPADRRDAVIDAVVCSAVDVFMKAYGTKSEG